MYRLHHQLRIRLGDAFQIIARRDADVMIAGGTEAAITPMGVGGFAAMRALSTRNNEPEKASRPWDKDRDGICHRRRRRHYGAGGTGTRQGPRRQNFAELVGYGLSADAFHITQPEETGDGGYRVMMNALNDANVAPPKWVTSMLTAPRRTWATNWKPSPSSALSANTLTSWR